MHVPPRHKEFALLGLLYLLPPDHQAIRPLASRGLVSEGESSNRISVRDLQAQWAEFTRPGDTLAVWNRGTFAYIQTALPNIPRRLLLKSAYCNLRPTRGMLEEIVLAERLLTKSELTRNQTEHSRTHERLANAVAVARFLGNMGRLAAAPQS